MSPIDKDGNYKDPFADLPEQFNRYLVERIEELLAIEKSAEARKKAISALHYPVTQADEEVCAEDRYPYPCTSIRIVWATPRSDDYEALLGLEK